MKRLSYFAWFVAGFNLLTIVGGAVVRATESGAGCGRSWPLCQGTVVSGAEEARRLTELTHRSMSVVAALLVAVLVVLVFRKFGKGTQTRRAVFWAGVTIIVESLLGAWLVLAELVEQNSSIMRAVAVPVHLTNTFLLLAAIALTAWLLGSGKTISWSGPHRRSLLLGTIGMLLLGVTGGIAALADTLFPATSVADGIIADFASAAHFLTRLRVIHPILAVLLGAYVLSRALKLKDVVPVQAQFVAVVVVLQLFLGLANVVLLTPLSTQLAHLVLADLLWIGWVLLGAAVLSGGKRPVPV
jgi:cytochrome c oxidase assembly protein subunit 15